MTKAIVINASPLIILSRSGHISLLKHYADLIMIPTAVCEEINARGKLDITVKTIHANNWLINTYRH